MMQKDNGQKNRRSEEGRVVTDQTIFLPVIFLLETEWIQNAQSK